MTKGRRAKQRFSAEYAPGDQPAGETIESVSWKVLLNQGAPTSIKFSDTASPTPQFINISKWCVVGPLAKSIAVWFAQSHKNLSRASRDTGAKQITDGFVSFIVVENVKLKEPEDVTTELITKFLAYLDDKTSQNGKNLALSTRMHYWASVKRVLRIAVNDINSQATVLHIPFAPFSGRKRPASQAENTNPEELAKLLSICGADALETMNRILPLLQRIDDLLPHIDTSAPPQSDQLVDAAAYLIKKYKGLLPERKWLSRNEADDFVYAEGISYSEIRMVMHPELSDLVPFIYVLAGFTAFNQKSLMTLKVTQYGRTTLVGKPKFQISPIKARSNTVVRRSFEITDDAVSPPNILAFLEHWTKHLRPEAPLHLRTNAFLYANKWKTKKPFKSLGEPGNTPSREFTNAAIRYFRTKGIRYMGLREVRYTFAEIFRRMRPNDSDGLRVILGQKMVNTTDSHYRTNRAQAEAGEAIAGVMLAQQRMVESAAKVDIRKVPQHRERTAATPGFSCLDPLDSPVLGQRPGRLCWAYGRCPECPLATLDPNDAYALARLLQLQECYEESRKRLGTIVFEQKYGKSSYALKTKWLAVDWTKSALEKAARLNLGDLPILE